jgi:5-methylcytosine-specific restriction endonuclease McrA
MKRTEEKPNKTNYLEGASTNEELIIERKLCMSDLKYKRISVAKSYIDDIDRILGLNEHINKGKGNARKIKIIYGGKEQEINASIHNVRGRTRQDTYQIYLEKNFLTDEFKEELEQFKNARKRIQEEGKPQSKVISKTHTVKLVFTGENENNIPIVKLVITDDETDELKVFREREAKEINEAEDRTEEQLLENINNAKEYPVKRSLKTFVHIRNQDIAQYVKLKAQGICQLCEKQGPFEYEAINGRRRYLETHHINLLSEGGKDTIENTIALCPNCHKKMHIIKSKEDIGKLKAKAKELSKKSKVREK